MGKTTVVPELGPVRHQLRIAEVLRCAAEECCEVQCYAFGKDIAGENVGLVGVECVVLEGLI